MAFWRRLSSWFGAPPSAARIEPKQTTQGQAEPKPESAAPKSRWPAILGPTFDYPDGGIAQAIPIADVRIQNVPCRAGAPVGFERNGRLSSAVLAVAHEVEGEPLPAAAWVMFESDGKLRGWKQQLTSDREFHVRAGDSDEVALPVTIPAGSHVHFEWGKLRNVTLAGPVAFDGVAFPNGTELIFGDSGALSHVTCPEEIELCGIRWYRGETVVFELGKLREGYPASDGTYDGVPYQFGEVVRLHENGRMGRCYIATDAVFSGVPCMAGTRIYLTDDGHLIEATVAKDCVLATIPVSAGDTVALIEGKPALMKPREDCEVDGIACAQGKLVELSVEGRLVRATLARSVAIGDWQLPAGSTVVVEQGKLRKIIVTDATAPDGRELLGMWQILLDDAGAIRYAFPVSNDWLGDAIPLRERTTIAGLLAEAKTGVELSPAGHVRSLVLATDQRVTALTVKAGTRVYFHDNGCPSNLYLVEDTRISGVPCAAARTTAAVINGVEHRYSEEVRLHADGSLAWAKLAEPTTFDEIPLKAGETIALSKNGKLHVGTLARRWQHSLGCVGRTDTLFGQFEDGSPSLVTLDAPFTLDGTEYPAGTVLRFTSPLVLESIDSARVPLGPCEPL